MRAPAWDEAEAIAGIRSGVTRWERGDEDAARMVLGCATVVLSSDQINIHHAFPGESVRSVARRGAVEAVSDIAATGAALHGVQIDVRAPNDFDAGDFLAIGQGVDDALSGFGQGLLLQASNMSRGEFGISYTAVGISKNCPLSRRGAQPGDIVAVSGPIGGWDGALEILNSGRSSDLTDDEWREVCEAFLGYQAELDLGQFILASGLATACIDANDQIAKTLQDLAAASMTRLEIDYQKIPVHPVCAMASRLTGRAPADMILNGISGDDRLLFTVDSLNWARMESMLAQFGRPATPIGRVGAGAPNVEFSQTGGLIPDRYRRPTEIYSPMFSTGRAIAHTKFPHAGRVVHP